MPSPVQYGYVTDAEIVTFMKNINSTFETVNVNQIFANASFEFMKSSMNEQFNLSAPITDSTQLLDGTGFEFVYSNLLPILSITSIKVIAPDGVKTSFVTAGTTRNIWWDTITGRIWVNSLADGAERSLDGDMLMFDPDDVDNFSKRPDSIEVIGKFGNTSTDLVKLIQLLMILKNYTMVDPMKYHPEAIEESIGKYRYRLPSLSTNSTGKLGLDQYIDKLMAQAFTVNNVGMESI